MQKVGGACAASYEAYARNSLYFWSKCNLSISDKNSCILNVKRGITKQTQINSPWTDITTSLVPVLQSMKTGNDRMECIEKQSAFHPPTHCTDSVAHCQSERPFSWHTTNQRIPWLRRPTALLLRLRMLNWSWQRPPGSESFQRSWTHQTYMFLPLSESPQMIQMSNSWAGVFLPLKYHRGPFFFNDSKVHVKGKRSTGQKKVSPHLHRLWKLCLIC